MKPSDVPNGGRGWPHKSGRDQIRLAAGGCLAAATKYVNPVAEFEGLGILLHCSS